MAFFFFWEETNMFLKGEHVVAVVAMVMSTDPAPILLLGVLGVNPEHQEKKLRTVAGSFSCGSTN